MHVYAYSFTVLFTVMTAIKHQITIKKLSEQNSVQPLCLWRTICAMSSLKCGVLPIRIRTNLLLRLVGKC